MHEKSIEFIKFVHQRFSFVVDLRFKQLIHYQEAKTLFWQAIILLQVC